MKLKKQISLLLAAVMTFGSVNLAFADTTNNIAYNIKEESSAEAMANGTFVTYPAVKGFIVFDKSTGTVIDASPRITYVNIPPEIDGVPVTAIGDYAFEFCINLKNIIIPDTVKYIGTFAFAYCEYLENICIPEGVTVIKYGTFYNDNRRPRVYIPDSVTVIEGTAFSTPSYMWGYEYNDVRYGGSKEQWDAIKIDPSNDLLLNSTINYNSSMPTIENIESTTETMTALIVEDNTIPDDCIKVSPAVSVNSGDEIKDFYLNFTPYDEIASGDAIVISIENGRFNNIKSDNYESCIKEWNSSNYNWKKFAEDYNLYASYNGEISPESYIRVVGNIDIDSYGLPYYIEYLNERQISVKLFPIPSEYCNTKGEISKNEPYYNIPIVAIAEAYNKNKDVKITIKNSTAMAIPRFSAVIAEMLNNDEVSSNTTETTTESTTVTETTTENTTATVEISTESTTAVTESTTTEPDYVLSGSSIVVPVEGGNIYIDKDSGEVADCDEGVVSVNIPSKVNGIEVKSISATAFAGCKDLKSITIPDTVTAIAENAFADCVSLTEIHCTKGSYADNKEFYPENTEIKYEEKPAYLYGDADGDGKLIASDAAAVLQKVLKSTYKLPIEDLTPDYEKYLDVDGSGKLDAADAAMILQKVLKSTYKFSVEQ